MCPPNIAIRTGLQCSCASISMRQNNCINTLAGIGHECQYSSWPMLCSSLFLHHMTCSVAPEDGIVACFDARKGPSSAPLYRLAAHDKPTCALSFCPAAPGLLATASTDKMVRSLFAQDCQIF